MLRRTEKSLFKRTVLIPFARLRLKKVAFATHEWRGLT